MSEWIDVKQELPPDDVEVLTMLRTGRQSIRERKGGFGWSSRQGRFTTDKGNPLDAPSPSPT